MLRAYEEEIVAISWDRTRGLVFHLYSQDSSLWPIFGCLSEHSREMKELFPDPVIPINAITTSSGLFGKISGSSPAQLGEQVHIRWVVAVWE